MPSPTRSHAFTTTLEAQPKGKARVPVPFDPNARWGTKREHHIGGTIAGMPVRGTIVRDASGWSFSLGPAWLRDCPVGPGHAVEVVIIPEGPQRSDLAPDLADALAANPAAGEFFDTLAPFYRKGYLRWIDATTRRPDLRAERITEVVRLLNEGTKQRPAAQSHTTSLGTEQASTTRDPAKSGLARAGAGRTWDRRSNRNN